MAFPNLCFISSLCPGDYSIKYGSRDLTWNGESVERQPFGVRTGVFNAVRMASSLIAVISERRKYFRAGYRIHQTSVLGRLAAAETRKEAAAREGLALAICWVHVITCRIQVFGWYKKLIVAVISSQ